MDRINKIRLLFRENIQTFRSKPRATFSGQFYRTTEIARNGGDHGDRISTLTIMAWVRNTIIRIVFTNLSTCNRKPMHRQIGSAKRFNLYENII